MGTLIVHSFDSSFLLADIETWHTQNERESCLFFLSYLHGLALAAAGPAAARPPPRFRASDGYLGPFAGAFFLLGYGKCLRVGDDVFVPMSCFFRCLGLEVFQFLTIVRIGCCVTLDNDVIFVVF